MISEAQETSRHALLGARPSQGAAQSKWARLAGKLSMARGGPHDRRGTASSRSDSPNHHRKQLACPPWRPAVTGASQSKWARLAGKLSRARGGPHDRRGTARSRSEPCLSAGPSAGPPPDGVRRRWGAGSAPGSAGPRRARCQALLTSPLAFSLEAAAHQNPPTRCAVLRNSGLSGPGPVRPGTTGPL